MGVNDSLDSNTNEKIIVPDQTLDFERSTNVFEYNIYDPSK